jgi:hypothetical protein
VVTVAVDIQVQSSLAANMYAISGTVAVVYPKDGSLYSASDKMLAFAMAFHSRLGSSSKVATNFSSFCAELVYPHVYPM